MNDLRQGLIKLKTASDSLNSQYPAENVYLQMDKPYYTLGDTIWFKAWIFNRPTLNLSGKSGLLHIDLMNDSNKVVKQYLLPVQDGITWGNIALNDDYTSGSYTLRAYTNWMRNFDDRHYFYQHLSITSPDENNWLVNTNVTTSRVNDQDKANARLQLFDMNKVPVAVKPFTMQVKSNGKNLYKQKIQSDVNGLLDVNFMVPVKSSNVVVTVENEGKDHKVFIPLNLNRTENIDLQFLPEGGNLVAGISCRVGFKAIGEDGKGIDISGVIVDRQDKQVTSFRSMHKGMGSFNLLPDAGEVYSAKVKFADGTVKAYPLPIIKTSGTTLQVTNAELKDSVDVVVSSSADLLKTPGVYYLIVKARDVFCYGAIVNITKGNSAKMKIAKKLFPTGIVHFILQTTAGVPLNERLVYIDHHDELHIDMNGGQETYAPKDSIALHLTITDNEGSPVAGNFALAVTDDAQVKTDSLAGNIITHQMLAQGIKGTIEEPGYYLKNQPGAWQALDDLLLTQGWTAYDAPAALPLKYEAETEFAVKGTVTNAFNKPLKGTHVQLLSKSPLVAMDTVTDKEGRFIFHHFPKTDTPIFVLNAVNRNGKRFNVGIEMDDKPTPVFNAPLSPSITPWYVNSDAVTINYTKKNDSLKKLRDGFMGSGHILKEVRITAKKIVTGSQNLNGPGNADLVLDEKDMEKAGKKTWLAMFQEKIKGFKEGYIRSYLKRFVVQNKTLFDVQTTITNSVPGPLQWYFIEDKPTLFIIDGVPFGEIVKIPDLGSPNYADIRKYLESHNAEDIKGIEVSSTTKYALNYFERYVDIAWKSDRSNTVRMYDFSFIEITTRSGNGPGIINTPGTYLYKPLALSWPKQFYKPKYQLKDTTKRFDLRSTIDWEPNVTTNANGKATVSFYAAERPGTYTVIVEGTDMNGNLGYKRQKIVIKKEIKKSSSK